MTALKQKTGKKGDWFGSPTPCLKENRGIIFTLSFASSLGTRHISEKKTQLIFINQHIDFPRMLQKLTQKSLKSEVR